MANARKRSRTRTTLVAAAAAVAAIVAACNPTKPPPPPSNPHRDVLILGDSIAAGIGCQLGDPGQPSEPPFPSCPGRQGISVANGWLGACSITGGWLHLYGTAGQPYPNTPSATNQGNCQNWRQTFPSLLNLVTPELVILMTGGWEIVDRWATLPSGCNAANIQPCPTAADRQWGSGNATNTNAVDAYRSDLLDAIALFASAGIDVLVVNTPYIDPPTPGNLPDPIYWEPYDQSPPSWSAAGPGYFYFNEPYRHPNTATPYKPSENKVDAFNAALTQMDANDFPPFATDVRLFDLWDYFSPQIGADREFSAAVCVNPSDPLNLTNLRSNPAACPAGSSPTQVRHPDGGHFLEDGYEIATDAMLPVILQMLAT